MGPLAKPGSDRMSWKYSVCRGLISQWNVYIDYIDCLYLPMLSGNTLYLNYNANIIHSLLSDFLFAR